MADFFFFEIVREEEGANVRPYNERVDVWTADRYRLLVFGVDKRPSYSPPATVTSKRLHSEGDSISVEAEKVQS